MRGILGDFSAFVASPTIGPVRVVVFFFGGRTPAPSTPSAGRIVNRLRGRNHRAKWNGRRLGAGSWACVGAGGGGAQCFLRIIF